MVSTSGSRHSTARRAYEGSGSRHSNDSGRSNLFGMAILTQVNGTVEKGFEPVRDAFAANFEQLGDVGAACCVHLGGRIVVDLWGGTKTPGGGEPYSADT